MSRIGRMPIPIPGGVEIAVGDDSVVLGPRASWSSASPA